MKRTVAPTPQVRRTGRALTIASLLAIAYATMLPEPGQHVGEHWCLICGSFGGVDALLNVLLFVPLGAGLALSGFSAIAALPAMCGLSTLIEITQFLVIPGRDSTIGDVLTNSLGGALGFALFQNAWIWLRPSQRIASILALGWCSIWLAIQVVSNYGFAPSLPDSLYFGQLAPSIGNFAVFDGRVLMAAAGDLVIPNSQFADSHAIRNALLKGASVVTSVVVAGSPPEIAPVVRVADDDKEEILLLAQQQESLLFGVRSGAAVLRLRRPQFALHHVFRFQNAGNNHLASDTLTLSGRYLAREVAMKAENGSATSELRMPLTASLGWTFLLPLDWQIEGTRAEFVVSCVWTACLVIPFGYWAALTGPALRTQGIATQSIPALLGLALTAAGFLVVPNIFGLSFPPASEWVCAFGGLFLGQGLARLT